MVKNPPANTREVRDVGLIGVHTHTHTYTPTYSGGPAANASLVAQMVKNPPPMQETRVRSLVQEDPLKIPSGYPFQYSWVSLVAQLVKSPPAMWETWVPSLGWENPLEKGTATHSSIMA